MPDEEEEEPVQQPCRPWTAGRASHARKKKFGKIYVAKSTEGLPASLAMMQWRRSGWAGDLGVQQHAVDGHGAAMVRVGDSGVNAPCHGGGVQKPFADHRVR